MTSNPLRDKIAGIPRYQPTLEITDETSVSCYMVACAEGYWLSRHAVLAILDAHPEQPAPDAVAEAWTSDWQWWAGSASDEMMTVGPCDTREQAIAEAIQDGFGEWKDDSQDSPVWKNTFVICECRQDPLRLADWIGAEWILERSDEALVDSDRVSSEFDDGPWFEASPEQEADLRTMLETACDEWQRKHNLKFSCCTFSHSRNHETVTTDALRALASQKETQG